MQIYAYDGGSPPLSATLDVTVTVEDTNDNSPVFTETSYQAILEEDWPLEETFVQVEATDKDEGLNGQVRQDLSCNYLSSYS